MHLRVRSVLFIDGAVVLFLSFCQLVPAAVDYWVGNRASMTAFLGSSAAGFSLGLVLLKQLGSEKLRIDRREMFVITVTSWLLACGLASLPFAFAEISVGYVDALFEATSGITSTGSTVFSGLETMPAGILLWRSLIQWLGGIGLLLVVFAAVPSFGRDQLRIINAEGTGISSYFSYGGRYVKTTVLIYCSLTLMCFGAFILVGLDLFNAVAHALTTVATGGFSTHDRSIAAFDNLGMELIMVFFMIVCSFPYILLMLVAKNQSHHLFANSQVRLFSACCLLAWLSIFLWLLFYENAPFAPILRSSIFTVTSIATGSGFTSADYTLWGTFPVAIIFFVPLVGGCVDSSACGIKAFRLRVNWNAWRLQMTNFFNGGKHNNVSQSEQAKFILEVRSFLFLYFGVFSLGTLVLAFLGTDFITACSAVMSTLTNLGPGIGPIIGPSGNFAPLSDSVKWVLMSLMLLGRLEIIAILVIFRRKLWSGNA